MEYIGSIIALTPLIVTLIIFLVMIVKNEYKQNKIKKNIINLALAAKKSGNEDLANWYMNVFISVDNYF